MIRNALIVDCETTGLEPARDRIVEIGCVLYSVEHKTPLVCWSSLVHAPDGNPAEAVNRIPAAALTNAIGLPSCIAQLGRLANMADIFCAHRAEFDRTFVQNASPDVAAFKPWVCTKFDVEWPLSKHGASCVELALAHNVPVMYAHRALTDCMLLSRTFENVQAMGHDLATMLERALRPKVTVAGLLPFERNDELKAAGFRWFPKPIAQWRRTMFVDDVPKLGFPTKEVAA